MLPKPERRTIERASRMKIWIYSAPFAGKSTLADTFPKPLFLSTDGNINSYTAPVVEIKPEYSRGLQVKTPWEVFVGAVEDLARGGHGFETVVVDLVEDVFEHCRVYSCKKLGIEHESDNNFKAWDYVSLHFLDTFKKLTTLPMNVVLLSHCEHRKVIRRSGEEFYVNRPLIRDKVANKIAGMVDIVAYLTVDTDGRHLNFKTDDGMFGGGRLSLVSNKIDATFAAVAQVYTSQRPLVLGGTAPSTVAPTVSLAGQSSPSAATQVSTPAPIKREAVSTRPQDGTTYVGLASAKGSGSSGFGATAPAVSVGSAAVPATSSPDDDIPF